MWSGVQILPEKKNQLTGDGAADLSPARTDTSTVPDHGIFGSLVGFSHCVGLLVDLVVAPFLGLGDRRQRREARGVGKMRGGMAEQEARTHLQVCFCT